MTNANAHWWQARLPHPPLLIIADSAGQPAPADAAHHTSPHTAAAFLRDPDAVATADTAPRYATVLHGDGDHEGWAVALLRRLTADARHGEMTVVCQSPDRHAAVWQRELPDGGTYPQFVDPANQAEWVRTGTAALLSDHPPNREHAWTTIRRHHHRLVVRATDGASEPGRRHWTLITDTTNPNDTLRRWPWSQREPFDRQRVACALMPAPWLTWLEADLRSRR